MDLNKGEVEVLCYRGCLDQECMSVHLCKCSYLVAAAHCMNNRYGISANGAMIVTPTTAGDEEAEAGAHWPCVLWGDGGGEMALINEVQGPNTYWAFTV